MTVVPTVPAFENLKVVAHIRSCFFEADAAVLFLVLVLPAVITKTEVFRELVIVDREVNSILDIVIVEVLVSAALFAFEAVLALPLLGDVLYLRLKAERVVGSVADSAEHQQVFVGGLSAVLTGFAVQALPVGLVHSEDVIGLQLETERVEALPAQDASHELLLVSE